MKNLILPEQNNRPETVFVFGAGASYPAKLPLQSDLIRIIADEENGLGEGPKADRIRQFLSSNFSTQAGQTTLEEVFGFLDYFIEGNLDLSRHFNRSILEAIRSDLARAIHYVIAKLQPDRAGYLTDFWEGVLKINPYIGVINMNYDTLLDEAFDTIYPKALIDYCIDFTNFRMPSEGDPFNWWVDPKFPILDQWGEAVRIKMLKVHGSLNWKYCAQCGQITLTPWSIELDFEQDSFVDRFASAHMKCLVDGNPTKSLLQLPAFAKDHRNFIFSKLHEEAAFILSGAKNIIFIGYSLPPADIYIRGLMKRTVAPDANIIVVNKSRSKDLKHRYEALGGEVSYYEYGFEQFVTSPRFAEVLATA